MNVIGINVGDLQLTTEVMGREPETVDRKGTKDDSHSYLRIGEVGEKFRNRKIKEGKQ